jgi:hypothetical protein
MHTIINSTLQPHNTLQDKDALCLELVTFESRRALCRVLQHENAASCSLASVHM